MSKIDKFVVRLIGVIPLVILLSFAVGVLLIGIKTYTGNLVINRTDMEGYTCESANKITVICTKEAEESNE